MELLCCLICGASTSEGVEHDISWFRRNEDGPLRNHHLQFIHSGPDLEFLVTVRRRINPEVRQVHPLGIHLVAVAAVVSNFLATVSTGFDRQTKLVEHTRGSLRVVQEGIMCRIKLLPARIGALHCQGDPVSEAQPLCHDRSKLDSKFGCCIKEKCPAQLQNAATFQYPFPTPGQVFRSRYRVIVPVPVVLPKIERWICKNGVDNPGLKTRKNLQTICVVENSVVRGQEGLFHLLNSHRVICRPYSSLWQGPWKVNAKPDSGDVRESVPTGGEGTPVD